MIYRQLIEDLEKWSQRPNRKPLVLRGARQVGKTTLIDEFGKRYTVYIKLNLEQSTNAALFDKSDNVTEIFQLICLLKKVTVDESKRTLLFIDEIQNAPKAVGLLRYFYEEMPWLHIIAAGSRLQSLIKQRISFPVGRVDYLSLRPCSFIEYLYAMQEDELADKVKMSMFPLSFTTYLCLISTVMPWSVVCPKHWYRMHNRKILHN